MKISILSDSPMIPTGYRNQAVMFAQFMKDRGHEIHYLANAYNGTTLDSIKLQDGTVFDWKIYGEMNHSYFRNIISPHLKQTKSDVFWILLDTFMLHGPDGWFLNTDTSPAKTFFWYPSDGGGGMPKGCERILRKIECPVSMAEFGQKQVKDYYGIDTEHIPHGTEPDRFYRLPDEQRNELRKKWGFQDKFVIGVVARNQPRKHLDRTIKAMSIIKDKIPNAILFLHMDPNDPANQLFNLYSLIQKFGLENRIVFSGMQAHAGWDWTKMNEVYNIMDCFFLSTSGEGFGIPIIEAMSAQVPVVATDYTTTPELILKNNAGLGIKLAGTEKMDMFSMNMKEYDQKAINTFTGSWEVERGICDVHDAANQIEKLYKDKELGIKFGENGREAVLKKYDFQKVVGPKWARLIEDGRI